MPDSLKCLVAGFALGLGAAGILFGLLSQMRG